MCWNVCFIANLCRSILSLSGVDHLDCLSPCFSVLCELWVDLVVFHIAPHCVHPPQSGPSSRSLLSRLHLSYFLCNNRVISSGYMVIQRKAFLSDMRGDWLDHGMLCYNIEILPSYSVFQTLFSTTVTVHLSFISEKHLCIGQRSN